MAEAEEQVASLLAETAPTPDEADAASLADRLDHESELAVIQADVSAVEHDVIADWGTDRLDKDALRARLGDIASKVSVLVRSGDGAGHRQSSQPEESLYDRVQKFAGPEDSSEPAQPDPPRPPGGLVSDRLTALEQLQDRS